MTEDHERIDELLAGYALGALSEQDAEEADRLLTEHVPGCARCRETLADFQAVAGDLALSVAPAEPSELLAKRVARDVSQERGGRRRGAGTWLAGAAAALVAAFGLVGWNVVLQQRVSEASEFRQTMAEGFRTLAMDGSEQVQIREEGPRIYVTYLPGSGHMILMGFGVPAPSEGDSYRVWGSSGGSYELLAEFTPDSDGLVAIDIPGYPKVFEELVVSVDPAGQEVRRPAKVRWSAPVA